MKKGISKIANGLFFMILFVFFYNFIYFYYNLNFYKTKQINLILSG
jgi:hypothetical protein